MIVVFDASILIYVVDANANAPIDLITNLPVDRCRDRVDHLIATLQQNNAKIVIPTPSLAEVLVKAGNSGPEFLRILGSSKHFRITSFDERAAVEFAAYQAARLATGKPSSTGRPKAKFDDQIIAIAAVEKVETIYSDDADITRLADGRFGIIGISGLPLPPEEEPQGNLPLE